MNTEVTTITYVAYLYYSRFFYCLSQDESVELVNTRNPQQQANEAPDKAFAFFYFDVVTAIVDLNGERIETKSDRLNISNIYYIDGKLLTDEEVRALPGNYGILLTNISGEQCSIMRCRTGKLRQFVPSKHELITTS